MDKLDVLYTIDQKYIDMMLGSAISLILNSGVKEIRLHIIVSGFEISDYQKVEDVLYKYSGVQLYFYDMKNFDIEKYNIPNWRGTQIANARLFFQDILEHNLSNIDNLLYLDSDTIVISNLNGLNEYKCNSINAVRDGCYTSYIEKLGGLSNYFNSGVLLFNVEKWTKGDYQDKLIHFIENNKKELIYPDQDILNCALDKEITEMPLNYNMGTNAYLYKSIFHELYYRKRLISGADFNIAKKDPKILHSTGVLGIKPWMKNNINPFNDEFMKYILLANPEFEKWDIDLKKKILTASPELFKVMLLTKHLLPEKVSELTRKLTI